MAYIPGYGFLSNPYIVFNDANGKPLSNGTVETYIAGTTTAYNTLKDWNGTYNGAIITLDIYGGCTIIAPETQGLKLIVKTSTGAAHKTFDNVFIGGSNQGYLPGTTTIRVDGTDGEIISVGTPDPDDPDKLIFTISLDPAITEAIATNASDIGGIQTHINNIDNSIIMINDTLDTLQTDVDIIESDVDTLQSDVGIVESDVAALKLSDQYTTFKATTVAGAAGYIFKIATALKTNAPLTSTTILEYDLTNNYIAKINAAWAMRGHVVHQQIMQMDDQYSSVDYMHYMHIYEFSDRWELWGQTKADWAGDISVRPSKNISINTTIHVNPWVFVGKAVSGSLPTVYTEHNWIDYTMPVNDSKKTSVWAEGAGTSDHKVMIDENDQGAKYLNDKILTGGILIKSIEAAGEVGNWYEVLRLTATLYTDGVTCSGTGTADDPVKEIGILYENFTAPNSSKYCQKIKALKFSLINEITSSVATLIIILDSLPDILKAYNYSCQFTTPATLGITTFKVVGPGNSILAIGDTLTSKVIKFSADQLNNIYATLADQTLVTATASISYVTATSTLSVGTETIVLDGAATEDAYFVCSSAFGVVTAIGAMEFDVPTLYRDVTWLGTAPALVGGKTYEISVVNGCGVIGGSV